MQKHVTRAAGWRLEYLKRKTAVNGVHLVLTEICYQMDVTLSVKSGNINDLELVQEAMSAYVNAVVPTVDYISRNEDNKKTIQ